MQEKSGALETPRVSIVDDDESVREAIRGLLRSVGIPAHVFGSAEEFLASDAVNDTACLILDVRMPGMSGLELQARLAASHYKIPLIFISAHASDREARARALEAGALDFLYKPFNEEVLLKNVNAALQTSGGAHNGE